MMSDKHRNPQFLSQHDICRPVDSGEMTVQLCAVKPPLPCIVILVHGVNDVGEAYENQDTGICAGLNDRLGRTDLHPHEWKNHEFMISDADGRISTKTCSITDQTCVGEVNRSPVIPFYWGYKPVDHAAFVTDQQRYKEELKKKHSEADLPYDTYQQDDARIIKNHAGENTDNLHNWLDSGFAKGGGTFANATTCIPDMFGPGAAGWAIRAVGKIKSRSDMNKGDWSHPIYENPHRIYQAYAARRLADLIIAIRRNPETETDTINIVAHSQGTIITLLANMWVKAGGFEPADCVILNHSPYSLEDRLLENAMPGNQQTNAGRQKTLANFCKLMASNGRYSAASHSHDAARIQEITDTGCLALDAQNTLWADPRYSRNNFGRVYNYFCPNDQIVSLLPVAGFGWCGVPDGIKARAGDNLHQRVFCKDVAVGDKTGFHFQMPPPAPDDPPDNPSYDFTDVTVDAPVLPDPFTFTLMGQGEGYKAKLAGNDPAIARAAMKAERFIPELVDVPDTPLFRRTYNDMPLNTAQLAELQTRYPWELVSGRYREVTQTFRKIVLLRRMTDAEIEQALEINISYSQHSSIVANPDVPRKAMAYDLAIGRCNAFEYKKFWEDLLLQADWRRPGNPDEYTRNYYQTGILNEERIKRFMNKPEREKGMPTGEQGVFNDYGSRIRPVGLSPYGVGYDDIPQWDMPEPLV